ncbi:MAG TPA: tRNA uridine-5-carboxymethylaminomethyl(34) synthesis GTPase MnmE [Pyrinomonadaceae bacterium]|nr:tRNA uridine-5-carboxymethylaminomethyl(34) synthesis GTPase MnmE [Pyrinomonadaceae bacterium]
MTDTIVALSTPPGRSGIGVIRLSGKDALHITRTLVNERDFSPQPNYVSLKKIRDPETDEVIDQSLITYFKAPHSFTGEDVIELSCHGSPVLLSQIIDLILRLDARAADPGEFTLRALANGRINLSQAEAVRDLINAQTYAATRQAARQLGGELSSRLQPIKDSLLEIIIRLESSLEFVEDDLPSVENSKINSKISGIADHVINLAATFRAGRILREGIKVTLVGRPNVGKSSIFNSLLQSDRAIVTDIPGTTRDSLSELLSLKGVPVLLTDTAGIRNSNDEVESLGVERTRRAIADADLVIVVVDSSESLTIEDREVLYSVADNLHIVALNKSDLTPVKGNGVNEITSKSKAIINISAKIGTGLNALREAILEPFAISDIYDPGVLITNARHFDLLQRTYNELLISKEMLNEGRSEELILVGLHNALRFLGEITGETTTEDILSQIFSTFCIGK